MYDAADDAAIVGPLDTPYIRRSRHIESGLSCLRSKFNEF
jgi:hypothetical protein